MDIQTIALVVAAASLAACAIGWFMGSHFSAKHILTEVAQQGVFNLDGVRYKVDRIGRRPKGE